MKIQWVFLMVLLAACHSAGKSDTPIFDGKTLQGWHSYGRQTAGKAWQVDSGAIHLVPGAIAGYQVADGGDLVSNDSFGNFELSLEWRIGKKANSGIILYVQEDTSRFKETWNTGPEMQVCDKDSNEDAHSYKHEAGDLYDLIPSVSRAAKGPGEWNQVQIKCLDSLLTLTLNGVPIIQTRLWDDHWRSLIAGSKFRDMPGFGSFTSGHIALQDHGEEVWYRRITIKRL